MDTITHTLFGLSLYGAVDKRSMSRKEKQALLFATVAGSQIPDIDVISAWWDSAGRYQMWHRGLTHSVLLVPLWGALLAGLSRWLWKTTGLFWFGIASLAVFIHDTSDLFNAWGTGYLEPLSSVRITFGTIPIVDLVFWLAMLAALLASRLVPRFRAAPHRAFRIAWLIMALHVGIQSAQGYALYKQAVADYDQVALSADFVPGRFTVVGKQGDLVELNRASVWSGFEPVAQLTSREDADLEPLFAANPRARTLVEWSPFVVVVSDGERLGVFDPRFYRNGESFLYEFIETAR